MKKIRYTQNYLKSPTLVRELIAKSGIKIGDTVIEVGAGKGIITKLLAEKVGSSGQVIALEIDDLLSKHLVLELAKTSQVKIVTIDARSYDYSQHTPYKVFSNLPFMYTSDLMNILVDENEGAENGYVIVQKESALMYGGTELGSETTLKSLLAIPAYTFSILHQFSKSDFTPSPQVETVLLGFSKRDNSLVSKNEYDVYKDFIAFTSGDRAGEGKWKKLFSKSDFTILSQKGLVLSRGLKLQTAETIIFAFHYLVQNHQDKLSLIRGSMKKLQKQQAELIKNHRTRNSQNWKAS